MLSNGIQQVNQDMDAARDVVLINVLIVLTGIYHHQWLASF